MRRLIVTMVGHPLFMGSMVMIFGQNLSNVFHYLFHLVIGRMLGPDIYGELATLFSLIAVIGIIPGSFGLVIVKFISSNRDTTKTSGLINWFYRKSYLIGLSVFTVMLVISPAVTKFLHLSQFWIIPLTVVPFIVSLPALVLRSSLQGTLRFRELSSSIIFESIVKLVLGIFFVGIGWALGGAVLGIIGAAVLGFLYLRFLLRDILTQPNISKPDFRYLFAFSLPIIFQSLAGNSFFTTDQLLAKHFLTPYDAGIYASLSTLGKIIFYGTGPISGVMFPMVSKRQSENRGVTKIFILGLLMTVGFCSLALLAYMFFPRLAVTTLFGSRFLSASDYLFAFGIFASLFAVCSYLVNFCLSLGRVRVVVYPIIAALVQIAGIWFNHTGLMPIIQVSIWVGTGLLFVLSLDLINYFRRCQKFYE